MKKISFLTVIVLISFFGTATMRADENMKSTVNFTTVGRILHERLKEKDVIFLKKTLKDSMPLLEAFQSSYTPTFLIVRKVKESYSYNPNVTDKMVTTKLHPSCQEIQYFVKNELKHLQSFDYTNSENAQKIYDAIKYVHHHAPKEYEYDKQKHSQLFDTLSSEERKNWLAWHETMALATYTQQARAADPIFQNCKKGILDPNSAECQNRRALYIAMIPACKLLKPEDFNSAIAS
jgi:hypothetical protein